MNTRALSVVGAILSLVVITFASAVARAQGDRPPPPPPASPDLPQLPKEDFLCAYDHAKRPQLVIADILDVPGGAATDMQQMLAQQLATAVRSMFEDRTIRMVGAAESDKFRVDPQVIALARRSTGAAAGHVARQVRADFVVLLKLTSSPSRRGAEAFDLAYEVLDVSFDPPRSLGQDIAFLEYRDVSDGAERVRINRRFATFIAKRVMDEFIEEFGGCEAAQTRPANPASPGAPPRQDRGRAGEFALTIIGDIDDWEIPDINKRLSAMPSIDRVLNHRVVNHVPEFGSRYRQTEIAYQLSAYAESFDVATQFAAAFFMATGKDSRVKSSDRRSAVLEVKNPMYSTWIGRESPANRAARAALRAAYERAGAPPTVILVDEVVGKDFKEETWVVVTWKWWHAHVAWHTVDLWQDVGDPRTFAGEAITRAVVDHISNLGIDVIDDIAGVVADMQHEGLIREGQDVRASDVDTFLRERFGVRLIIRGNGEVSRRLDQVAVSYNFRGSDPGTRRTVVSTQTAARVVPFGDLAAGRFTNEIGEELAGQIIEDLMKAWSEGRERMQIVIADADTIKRADEIRATIEGADGVAYTSFRALGSQGMVIEVTHRGAGDEIRRALEAAGLALQAGSSETRLMLRSAAE